MRVMLLISVRGCAWTRDAWSAGRSPVPAMMWQPRGPGLCFLARPGAAKIGGRARVSLALSEQLPGPGLRRRLGQYSRGSVARETLGSCEL